MFTLDLISFTLYVQLGREQQTVSIRYRKLSLTSAVARRCAGMSLHKVCAQGGITRGVHSLGLEHASNTASECARILCTSVQDAIQIRSPRFTIFGLLRQLTAGCLGC